MKQKIKEIIINIDSSILNALKQMDKTNRRLLLVFESEQFINLLSIGDIQRAIIQNKALESHVREILRKETNVADPKDKLGEIKKKMLKYRAEFMPVVDKNNQLIDVYFWEDLFPEENKRIQRNLNLPVVILAGGKGTRMKPLTNVLPKPLIPVGEKSILEHIMDRFSDIGCHHFFLSVNYKAEMIRHYFEHLNLPDYTIDFYEEAKPLGTAGSLYLLKGKIKETFFVSNCDIIIEEDYGEIYDYHKGNNNDITIVAALKHYPIPYGTIETVDNGILKSLSEKPELTFKINSGMYILEPHVLSEIPKDTLFHITELIEKIKHKKGKVGVFPVSEKSWKDIGTWKEYMNHAM